MHLQKNGAMARELAALALCADDALLDLLCEDGLVSPAEARREHSPAQLLALLRRIFGVRAALSRPLLRCPCGCVSRPDAPPSLRAPPAMCA